MKGKTVDTVIRLNLDYCKDEIRIIINDYTKNMIWSIETQEQIMSLIKSHFLNNKKQIIQKIDAIVCNEINKLLASNGYIINGGKYE